MLSNICKYSLSQFHWVISVCCQIGDEVKGECIFSVQRFYVVTFRKMRAPQETVPNCKEFVVCRSLRQVTSGRLETADMCNRFRAEETCCLFTFI
jgi:hypothetical protein